MTLTIPNVPVLNKEYVEILRGYWKKLRRRKSFSCFTGGWYTIEVTDGESDGYNLHMHVLARGLGFDVNELREDWFAITKISQWARFEPVRSSRGAMIYLGKEISKGSKKLSNELSEQLGELKGVRLLQSWGSLPPIDVVVGICPSCSSVDVESMFDWAEEQQWRTRPTATA